jgi:hypothetical protein
LPGGGGITFAPVGAVDSGAELSAVGALDEGAGLPGVVPGVVGVDAGTLLTAGVVTDVVAEFTGDAGLSGDAGDIGLVGLLIDFVQASDVVTQGP